MKSRNVLSINAAYGSNITNKNGGSNNKEDECDENLSPGGSKRKSQLISPSYRTKTTTTTTVATNATTGHLPHHRPRNPLSDVNSKTTTTTSIAFTPSKPRSHHHHHLHPRSSLSSSTPSRRTSTPSTSSSTSSQILPPYHSGSNNNFNNTVNKFKPKCLGKEDIEATDDTQASVNQLSNWLTESAKKNRKKKPIIVHRPPPSSSSSSGSNNNHNNNNAAASTPTLRFHTKPRIKQCDVQATNSKIASVKTLSSWMDGDPFEQKKIKTIRTGHRVISKSRIFERDHPSSRAVRDECDIRTGSVEKKSAWLSEAFGKGENGNEEGLCPQPLAEKKIRAYQCKKESTPVEMELKSVRDKKEWLSKAFQKGEEMQGQQGQQQQGQQQGGETTPIIHHAKSFDGHAIRATANNAVIPDIPKCASMTDDGATATTTPVIGGPTRPPTLEKQRSIVRLYDRTPASADEEEEDEFGKRTSVHDKQAWLSNAFVKKQSNGAAASPKDEEVTMKSDPIVTLAKSEPIGMPAKATKMKKMSVGADGNSMDKRGREVVVEAIVEAGKTEDTRTVADSSGDDDGKINDNMSVAARAKWLRGAFK